MGAWKRETLLAAQGLASVVAGVLNNRCDTRYCEIKGGDLDIEWDKTNNQVYLTEMLILFLRRNSRLRRINY